MSELQPSPSSHIESTERLGPTEYGLTLTDAEADAVLDVLEQALHAGIRPHRHLAQSGAFEAGVRIEAARNRDQEPWSRGAVVVAVTYRSPRSS